MYALNLKKMEVKRERQKGKKERGARGVNKMREGRIKRRENEKEGRKEGERERASFFF